MTERGDLGGSSPRGGTEISRARYAARSATAVTFCGGEPLLVRDIGSYAKEFTGNGKPTVLNTNGSLLRRRLDQGLEFAFTAVGVSIDGSTEAVHRAMRGAKADLGEVLHASR